MKYRLSLCSAVCALLLFVAPLYCHGENPKQWWHSFDDSRLDTLIAIGMANNYDVSMAMRRIDIAKATVRQAESAWYPQLGLEAGWNKSRQSGRIAGREGSATGTSYFRGEVTMSWEIDVFGKVRAQVNHDKKQMQLSSAEFDGAMLTVQASIATAYFTLLMHRAQLALANEHVASQKQLLSITEKRYKTKLVSKLDVAQASTLYYGTESSIPALESSIEADYNAIAVLLGLERQNLPSGIYEDAELPTARRYVLSDIPADMIRRRPDVFAASWTIFDGFGRRAATASARENMKYEVDNYNMTVIEAVQEVNNALSAYNATLRYIDLVQKAVDSSHESVVLSLDRYKQGLTDFYNVVEAHLSYLTYQNNLVSARGQVLANLIDLYKSLGGGF